MSVRELLWYDPDIYDKYSYQRDLLRQQMRMDLYTGLTIPFISTITDDFDEPLEESSEEPHEEPLDNNPSPTSTSTAASAVSATSKSINKEVIKIVNQKPITPEFYELLDVIYNFPPPFMTLISAKFVKQSILKHYKDLCEVMQEESSINQLIYFIPILYYVHHRTKWDDAEYILLLTITNIIDSDNPMFSLPSFPKQAYNVFKRPLDEKIMSDLESHIDQFLFDQTDDIFGDDLSKLRTLEFLTLPAAQKRMNDSCDKL
jgi:hypothetical protein